LRQQIEVVGEPKRDSPLSEAGTSNGMCAQAFDGDTASFYLISSVAAVSHFFAIELGAAVSFGHVVPPLRNVGLGAMIALNSLEETVPESTYCAAPLGQTVNCRKMLRVHMTALSHINAGSCSRLYPDPTGL